MFCLEKMLDFSGLLHSQCRWASSLIALPSHERPTKKPDSFSTSLLPWVAVRLIVFRFFRSKLDLRKIDARLHDAESSECVRDLRSLPT